ncbi:MAG TPA: DUF2269 family protein [Candidatus Thermoplasmatota archaeon]|nr:DUF2269 family protein [Candidatus Thermoplasmatota archaeon]
MVEPYLVLKWVHVLGATVLVGSFAVEFMLRRHAEKADVATRASIWHFLAGGEAVYIPIALTTVATGVLMSVGPWGVWDFFGTSWILGGVIASAALFVLGGVFLGPAAKRYAEALIAGRTDEAHAARKRHTLAWNVSFALALALVWFMVVKPTW